MPCMCWYEPSDDDKKAIKDACLHLVELVKSLKSSGDPRGYQMSDIHKLLDHLYNPEICEERPNGRS